MSCDNTNNCAEQISSNCVTWMGPDIVSLGISTGDTLTDIEVIIANKVVELLGAVNVSTVTLSADLIALLDGQDKSIANLFQVLMDYSTTLKGLIDSLTITVGNTNNPLALDFKCIDTQLDPCNPTTFTLQNIIQILINAFCDLKTQFTNLSTTITSTIGTNITNTVVGMVDSCQTKRIVVTGAGINQKLNFSGFVPPYTALPYFGPLTNFDVSGKGLDDTEVCGWYLCNGMNGTPDMRGRVPVGAIVGMGGGGLHADVDPALTKNIVTPTANYAIGSSGGEITHTITVNEMPSHGHTVNDPGHYHFSSTTKEVHHTDNDSGNPTIPIKPLGGTLTYGVDIPLTATTGISISTTGGTKAHENRMPYKGCAFIMMIN